jgi:hypothetical protein
LGKKVEILTSPESLNSDWDQIAEFYFQKREFLAHLHHHNPCFQKYYLLYSEEKLVAATLTYILRINFLTFLNVRSPVTMHIIGLPVSVAAPPVIGDPSEFPFLLDFILKQEKGFILGLNLLDDYLYNKVIHMRTLPTMVFYLQFDNQESYLNALRHPYRRRIFRFREHFTDVRPVVSDCSVFSAEHFGLYLEIMKRTKTKLEILNLDFFRKLPSNFTLTTYYHENGMLCWHITCCDGNALFFLFGGMDYRFRDMFQSYHNNLYGIITEAIQRKSGMIDLGQTAETAKARLGAGPEERRMFLYHRNPLVLNLIRPFSGFLGYTKKIENCSVFKNV